MKFAIVTNIPVPYRIPIYNLIAEEYGDDFLVIYCARKEANRQWHLTDYRFQHCYLKERTTAKGDGFNFIHNNPDVMGVLKEFNPQAVITTGYNPTFLYGWLYCILHGKKHIAMTDGWKVSERNLTFIHRLVRKIVLSTSKAAIGAGNNSMDLLASYGMKRERIFKSHLCADNDRFFPRTESEERKYHLMFAGQFLDIKLPYFFADVCREVKKKIKNLKVLIIGGGPLEKRFFEKLDDYGIDYDYPGFISQEELPQYYSSAKIFLFTTITDAWGIVANEALASGMPVLVTPYAGVIHDLVVDGENGYILGLDENEWAHKAVELLQDKDKLQQFSKNAILSVQQFSYENAANGIIDAVKSACSN